MLFSVPSSSIRKVKTSIDNLYLEKQKMEKGDKPKKKGGAKTKGVKLRVEGEVSF
jgi:translation initiation factor 3 subunit J